MFVRANEACKWSVRATDRRALFPFSPFFAALLPASKKSSSLRGVCVLRSSFPTMRLSLSTCRRKSRSSIALLYFIFVHEIKGKLIRNSNAALRLGLMLQRRYHAASFSTVYSDDTETALRHRDFIVSKLINLRRRSRNTYSKFPRRFRFLCHVFNSCS